MFVFSPHSLKVINHYRHASIQMGDKAFYTVKEADLQMAANTVGQNPAPLPHEDDHAPKQTTSSTETKTPTEEENTSSHDDVKQSESTDEDPDGGDHGAPKTKGSTQGSKHDSGPSSARFPVKRRRKRAKRKRKAMPHMQVNVGDRVCVEVVSTCTTVNVVWQNSSETTGIPSINLTPVFHLDEHEFFPGDYASDKRGKKAMAFSILDALIAKDRHDRPSKVRTMTMRIFYFHLIIYKLSYMLLINYPYTYCVSMSMFYLVRLSLQVIQHSCTV